MSTVAPAYDHADLTAIAGSTMPCICLACVPSGWRRGAADRSGRRRAQEIDSILCQTDSGNAANGLQEQENHETEDFIDGEHGTTGLQIRARMAGRTDLELLSIPEAEATAMQRCARSPEQRDIAILCLPDDASREAVAMVAGNNRVRIIDTVDRASRRARLGLWLCRDGQGAAPADP